MHHLIDVSTIFFFHFYNFLLIAIGMKAATSNNSRAWCKIHKNERYNFFEKLWQWVTSQKPYFMQNTVYYLQYLIFWVSGATCHVHMNSLRLQLWQEQLKGHGPTNQDAIQIHSFKYQLKILSWMKSTWCSE